MFDAFLDTDGIIYKKFVGICPYTGNTVNSQYYLVVLVISSAVVQDDSVSLSRTMKGQKFLLALSQQSTIIVRHFLTKKYVPVLNYLAHLADLASTFFYSKVLNFKSRVNVVMNRHSIVVHMNYALNTL